MLRRSDQITPENVERLLFSPYFTASFQRVSKTHGLSLPLKFSSCLDELNFLSVLSLLNFGSGFRVPLHAQSGRGAWDSIRALTFSLYITSPSEGDLLSAQGMRTLSAAKIADHMHLNLYVERPHTQIPGVTVGELGGPLRKLVEMIAAVLNETGEILDNFGYKNLGSFVAEALQHAGRSRNTSGDAEVGIFLERVFGLIFPFCIRSQLFVDSLPVPSLLSEIWKTFMENVGIGSLPDSTENRLIYFYSHILLQKRSISHSCNLYPLWLLLSQTFSNSKHRQHPHIFR